MARGADAKVAKKEGAALENAPAAGVPARQGMSGATITLLCVIAMAIAFALYKFVLKN